MRMFEPEDVKVNRGCTYQIYAIPWVDKNGHIVDISIGFTKFNDFKVVARQLWAKIERVCENRQNRQENEEEEQDDDGNWVEQCGSARQEYDKGHRMVPDLAFSLKLYAVGLIVACQLKWYTRLYYNSVKIMSTGESKYFLSRYNKEIKGQLNSFLEKLGPQNRDFVKLNGDQFDMPI